MDFPRNSTLLESASPAGILLLFFHDAFGLVVTHTTPIVIPLILIVTSLMLWRMYTSAKDPTCSAPLPPGSMGLPVIGETLNFIVKGSDFFRARTESYGRVYKTHILGQRTIRVTGARNVATILKGEGTLVETQWPPSVKLILGSGALAHSQGESHKWRRERVLKAFSPESVNNYIPSVQTIIREYVQKWCQQGSIHGYPEARSLMFTVASKLLLGFDIKEKQKFRMLMQFEEMLTTLFSMAVPIPGIGLYKGLEARRGVLKAISDCIQRRQDAFEDQLSEDALAIILEATEDDQQHPMSNREMQDSALEMLFAGHLPTSSAACSILIHLGMHPNVVDKLTVELHEAKLLRQQNSGDLDMKKLSELRYLDAVVKEVLRVAPPVGAGYRKALQTFEIDGCQVPKGWTVIYSIRETHHTAEKYGPDGLTFDPDRWLRSPLGNNAAASDTSGRATLPVSREEDQTDDFNYLPFGWGNRSCVGQRYAEMVLKVFVVELVRNATWKLNNAAPTMLYMPVPRPADNLPLSFKASPPDLRRRAFTMSW